MFQQADVILCLHVIGRRGLAPFRHDLGPLQQALCLLEIGRGNDQRRNALVARPARAAGPVQQRFGIRWQIGVDHQFQPRQVDPPRGHVCGDADPRAPVTQRLQRMGAFLLAKFPRQRHDLKAPVAHACHQMVHIGAGLAENDRGARFIEPQHVEDRMFPVPRRHRQGAIFDVDVLLGLALGLDAQRVALEILGQSRDLFRHGGREHQGAAFFRRGLQDEFQIVTKAEVEHLVRLVQHHGLQARQVKRAALDMVAQATRRADDDMRAAFQRALFGAIVHAAHAGGDLCARLGVKPFQLARDLQRQFPRRRDAQRHGNVGIKQAVRAAQQFLGDADAKGHGLARTGLRRNQHILARDICRQHGRLHRGQAVIALGRKGRSQRRGNSDICHVQS